MRLPDINVLIYARDSASPHHRRARMWLEQRLSATETLGFAVVGLLGFIRITTNPRAARSPLPIGVAFEQVGEWLAQPCSSLIHPGSGHLQTLRELLEPAGAAGNLTTDAHLAALAIENGATLATFDGDFHRFAGLSLEYLGG